MHAFVYSFIDLFTYYLFIFTYVFIIIYLVGLIFS